jgi:hypothetical protein
MYTVLNFCSTSSKGFFFNFSVVAHTIAHSTSFALDSSSCLRQYTILDQNCILSLMALAGMQIKACYGTQTRPRRPRRYHIWLDCRFTKEILYAIANGKKKKKLCYCWKFGIMQRSMLQVATIIFFSLMMSVRGLCLCVCDWV